MKFTITREALLKPLQTVGGVVERRHTLPILSNVLLQVDKDRLVLTGTDLEVELTAIAVPESTENGEITLPARKLVDICRALPEGARLAVEVDSDRAILRSGRGRFSLVGMPASDFPVAEPGAGTLSFAVSQQVLKGLMERTLFCMANQDVRYYLNGMLLEMGNARLRTVATDGHRLAISDSSCDDLAGAIRQVILPRKGVLELSRLLENSEAECQLQVGSNHFKAQIGDVTFTSKLVDGKFPDYERVVPRAGDKVVVADKAALQQVLQRTAILSNEKYRGVRLHLKPALLRAIVNNPEQEEAEEELEVDYDGSEFEIGFNVSYLLDALNAVTQERVNLAMSDANSSCLITGLEDTGSRYVVMPMRL